MNNLIESEIIKFKTLFTKKRRKKCLFPFMSILPLRRTLFPRSLSFNCVCQCQRPQSMFCVNLATWFLGFRRGFSRFCFFPCLQPPNEHAKKKKTKFFSFLFVFLFFTQAPDISHKMIFSFLREYARFFFPLLS